MVIFKDMDRSKCVICGRVRNRKFLTQFPNLENDKVWVCNREIGYKRINYVKIDNMSYIVNNCQIRYLKNMKSVLDDKISSYLAAKKCLYINDKIIQDKYVSPELTFLLM
ncbi:MAG: hypothetical protein CMP76_12280 [Flavobacterium sp.]|nr:hypothetical protein [Flavobacterium sp.]